MMLALVVFIALVFGASAFSAMPSRFGMVRANSHAALRMTTAPPGYKPSFDGTFKKAGEHPETFVLEHENGARAIVDTVTATCVSWKNPAGKEMITAKKNAHYLNGKAVDTHFVPEERAKKVSFDRMIFKSNPTDYPGLEYRVDVTMRENSLEYDVIIKNAAANTHKIQMTLTPNADGKITKKTGYTTQDGDVSVGTAAWDVPVGKLKEAAFYVKVEPK